ncbi:hypothetical protein JTE90_000131 [Oedothorax gibbosus]|uniref:Nuclear pore complex protein Nup160 n=1 Tax=Oedothorax gibbosus TaxID=931172 RepID=A0AAV6V320_9ARAC|nr:hypothetical protein JTE90_000131 [Oedothorax gibbosus]
MNAIIFREITPHSESVDRWNDVTINAGASQSTLQDIKLPECAGSFSYSNSGDPSSLCSNRFIYWRTNHDVIELVEISLDITLKNSHLRLRFQNTPILRGVSIHEYRDKVVLLVPTVSAIHKLVFPHPKIFERDVVRSASQELVVPSVFFDASFETLRNRSCYFVLNNVSLGIPVPHTACSWLNVDGNATFVLANSAGSVLMVVMSEKNGVEITSTELMKSGALFRLFTSIRSTKVEIALNIVCHKKGSDVLVLALFSDLQLRVWSSKKQECILVDSVLNHSSEKRLTGGNLNFTSDQCHLRISELDDNGEFYLGVYIPMPQQKIFYIFNPNLSSDQCKLQLSSTLFQDSYDLVDFSISKNRVWSLWPSCDNQPIVLTAFLDGSFESKQQPSWIPVNLEPQFSRTIDCGRSPQDAYLKEIFKVGRFLPSTITKAISIYSTAKNMSISSNVPLKIENLKNRVIEAVETEILMKTGNTDNLDEGYMDISAECWDRFFSYCIQYHEVGMKPLGIACDPNTGCVIVIKKNFYSLVCPCDPLEVVTTPELRASSFLMGVLDNNEMKMYRGLKAVLTCIDIVRKSIDNKVLMRFEDKLFNQSSPTNYASKLCESLDLMSESDFYKSLQSNMPSNSEVVACLEYLTEKFDLSNEEKEFDDSLRRYSNFGNSSSGVGALCAGLSHFAKQRFEFCRDLLLFEMVLSHSDCVEYEQLYNFITHSTIIPKTDRLLRSYYIILWCTQCECKSVSPSIQDAAFKQFCLLELPEFTNEDLTRMKGRQTISHLFFQESGGAKARKIMENNHLSMPTLGDWESLFPNLIIGAATLLWPLADNVVLPEFLFSRCQHVPLQEYDRLLQEWCTENKQFLNFLVACSHLILADSWKATKIFLDVSKEIKIESLLCEKIMKGRYGQGSSVTGAFYMRVIQLFEQFSVSGCIVKLATAALNELEEGDTHIPIFYSVLFKHHLNLGQSEEAFATLIKNPDSSRRKDCLRQLVVKLCESKQFQKIIELSYLAYEEEVISILESRARCSDLCHTTSFYRILYSLHLHHEKFRKAASVMYELAMRFGREVLSLKGLKKQASCYLAVINCLYLAEPQYAWLVKPATSTENDSKNNPKRNADGDEIFHSSRPVKVEVLGLEDIKKEYILVQSRLLHAQKFCNMPNFAISHLTAEETIGLLLQDGLYDAAIHLSKSFSLSLVPIFESLTYKCLSSSLLSDIRTSDDLDSDRYLKHSVGAYDTMRQNHSQVWHLLRKYLEEHEVPNQSDLHRCVTDKLLVHGAALPAWLRLSYQKRNFTELVSLYITHGMLKEALTLVHKYIKAVLGVRKEDFNLKFTLSINSPAVWLPHTYIDILLDAASELQDNDEIRELYQEFSDTLIEYKKQAESVTVSKLKLAFKD